MATNFIDYLTDNMDQKKGMKLFVNFLRENGAYMAFRANMLKQRRNLRKYDFFGPLVINVNIIDRMLMWRDTKEGHDYWYNLDREFKTLCAKISKEYEPKRRHQTISQLLKGT